jgi:L,D-transpeptidase YcbB
VIRVVLLFAILFSGCTYFQTSSVSETKRTEWTSAFDSAAFQHSSLLGKASVKAFYESNNFNFVWVDSGGMTSDADSMLDIIKGAEFFGLIPNDYHKDEIAQLLTQPYSHDAGVLLDLYLTDGFFSMRHHLKHGRLEKKSLARISLTNIHDPSAVASLQRALDKNSFREELELNEPGYREYKVLKAALGKLVDGGASDTVTTKRKNQLAVNMERWRWQTLLPQRYIAVNAPSFFLKVVDNDSVVLQSKVIVGKEETQTPEMESVVRSFIIYPYWHVPKSIVKELLPHIQEDSLYLRKHNYQVLNGKGEVLDAKKIDWMKYTGENFPFVLRQREGSENTMGVIKFVFKNNYGVYLHDTNARGLFSKKERALSHGCIRVQKAKELALYLAKDDDTYVGPEDLSVYFLLQHRMEIQVVKPIPVLLQYFTCAGKDDEVVFYDDIYKKDEAILKALNGSVDAELVL